MKSLGLFYLLFITLSQFVFTYSVDLSENAQSQCKKLGYPCCKKNNSHVYYHDKDGDWGYDFKKKEWCYIVTVQDAPQVTPKQGGNYVIYVDSKIEKNDTNFNNEVQSYINQIGQIIIDNLDTFEDKANLEQFQNEFKVTEGDVENVHNYNQDLFLYNNSRGNLVFMAYLNENILDDIKALPNVSTVEPEIRGIMDDKINITIEESNDPQVTPKQGGNYVIYVDSEITKNDTNFNNEVQSYINQIGQIIIDNLDTFEDKANLEQFQKEFKVTEGDVENVHNYNQDLFLYNNSRGNLVFMAYLNENILDDIKALPNVSTVEPEVRGIMDDKINITIEESNDPQVTPKQGGNYVIYVDSEITKNDPNFNNEVQSYINQIGQIIIDNLDTFEDKANLEQFQNEFKVIEGDVENVHNYNQDLFLYNNSRGNLVFMAYLNENILDDIKALPNVSTVEPEVRGIMDDKINITIEESNDPQVTPKQGGNYVIYVDSEITKNDPNFNNEVQSYINQIGQIIIDNLDTFEDKANLEQFQKEFKVIEGDVENVHNYNQDFFLYNNSRGNLVFMAYLNENILDDIKALPNVSTVEPEVRGTMDDKINITIEESNDPQVTPKQGGNYVIYVDSEITKNDPNFNNEVQSYINQIGQIIIDNLDTFEDKANLEQFQNEFKVTEGDVENVHNYNQDLFLYNNSRGNLVFMAYLNENILDDIKALPNVSTVEPEVRGTIDFKTTPKENDKERQCEKLGYACCKEDNTNVYYQDKDGAWGYDFDEDEWCIIVNQPQNATSATQVTPKQGSNYVIYVDSEITKNDPNFNNEVQSYINQIGQIIIDNLDTFEDKANLEQFQNEFKVTEGDVENVHNYNQDLFLYNNSRGNLVFMAYLNENILDDIKALPNVSTVEPEVRGTIDFKTTPKENEERQCEKLGYACCKEGNTNVYYQDKDGAWGYDFDEDEWCIIVNQPQNATPATQVTPKQGSDYVIYVDSEITKNDPNFNNEVQSYINQIGQIIIDNLNTFEDKDILEQFKNEFKVIEGNVENVHNYNQDLFLYNNSRGQLVFMAYLNRNIIDDVKALPNVSTVEKVTYGTYA